MSNLMRVGQHTQKSHLSYTLFQKHSSISSFSFPLLFLLQFLPYITCRINFDASDPLISEEEACKEKLEDFIIIPRTVITTMKLKWRWFLFMFCIKNDKCYLSVDVIIGLTYLHPFSTKNNHEHASKLYLSFYSRRRRHTCKHAGLKRNNSF